MPSAMSASEPKADVRTESKSLTSHYGEKRAESGHSSDIFSALSGCLKVAESGRIKLMKKLELGQAITILANLGVIVGIVFLAIEVHQNNQLLGAQAVSALLQTRMKANEDIYNNSGLADLLAKNRRGEPLTDAERIRLVSFWSRGFQGWQRDFLLFQEGILTEEYLWTNVPTLRMLLSESGDTLSMIEYWHDWSNLAPVAFREFVEQCVLGECDSVPR